MRLNGIPLRLHSRDAEHVLARVLDHEPFEHERALAVGPLGLALATIVGTEVLVQAGYEHVALGVICPHVVELDRADDVGLVQRDVANSCHANEKLRYASRLLRANSTDVQWIDIVALGCLFRKQERGKRGKRERHGRGTNSFSYRLSVSHHDSHREDESYGKS